MQTDRHTDRKTEERVSEWERERERQTDRQIQRQTERVRQTDREQDRPWDRHRYRKRARWKNRGGKKLLPNICAAKKVENVWLKEKKYLRDIEDCLVDHSMGSQVSQIPVGIFFSATPWFLNIFNDARALRSRLEQVWQSSDIRCVLAICKRTCLSIVF